MSDLRSQIIEAMARALSCAPHASPRTLAQAERAFDAIGEFAAVVPREADELIADIGEDAFACGFDGHEAFKRMVSAADILVQVADKAMPKAPAKSAAKAVSKRAGRGKAL